MGTMIIDGQHIEFTDEKNILAVIRKVGIELPTFCYHSELSVYGACRMCMVEDKWGSTITSCSTPPKDGMEVWTNTDKLKKHRKMILELLLANHDRDCTTCEKSGRCKLQEIALKVGVKKVRFGQEKKEIPIDDMGPSVIRNPNKCILCGDCVRACQEIQGVGVLDFAYRGSNLQVTTAFNKSLQEVDCVNCGQCRVVCPTGALMIKKDIDRAYKALHDKNKRVIAQIAPAVRVAIGEDFGLQPGEISMGKIVSALRKLGFDQVFDTAVGADLTVIEEAEELMDRIQRKEKLPLFSSCCPAWFKYAEQKHPDLMENVSSCLSPQQMFGAVIKEQYKREKASDEKENVVIAIMPCTAKKYEAARPENTINGERQVDMVITTQELAIMIQENGIVFNELEDEAIDMPFGFTSGAGVIFGVSGGVSEAVLRYYYKERNASTLRGLSYCGVRGMEGVKEASAEIDGRTVRIGIVHGLKNAEKLIRRIKSGEEKFDFIEVMACPGGCIGGAGQPIPQNENVRKLRAKGIYKVDKSLPIKRSDDNPTIDALYNGILNSNRNILHRNGKH
ncbi:[FeFe] hydrogenase, group A [Ruminiclostridium cellulolyticum]|uniref:Hydrogenase, Fe-only n=1 Tax=Ruminiclostridium cellulolyticum (strain ATCC 35319 / DSM 5812 / JCM 6584 / H10) TaxID=394503 RepID=B8I4Y6_RUMCH|nr:[FeFe] hydrogenase, group A [Ruminiclostridium cellulolyticum]ACL76640.1 hydrogenase, Fe-only [Ruminiclostridium cellulolyticum H10]